MEKKVIDEALRSRIIFWILAPLGFLLFFFAFAEPIALEFNASPVWYKKITSETAAPVANAGLSFSNGAQSGFFSPDGLFSLVRPDSGGVLMDDAAWISLPGSDSAAKTVMSRSGQKIGAIDASEQPFFAGSRLFSASEDSMTMSSYSDKGEKLWQYAFPCQVSAFDVNDSIVVAGMLDGTLSVIDGGGKHLTQFAPGGSRLQVILGVATSPSGSYVAMVSGIDKQRLVILGKGDKDYRVVSHSYLASDFRTSVPVAILADERFVLYRHAQGIGVFSIDGKVDTFLPVAADSFTVHSGFKPDIYYIVTKNSNASELLVFSPPDRLLGRTPLPAQTDFIRITDASVYIGCYAGVARIDFEEN